MEAPSTSRIVKVVEEITEAAQAAGQNKERCQDIADSARAVLGVLSDRAFRLSGGVFAQPRRTAALDKLEATLKDGLELIKAQSCFIAFFSSGDADASFQDVENKFRACVRELGVGLMELFVSHRQALRASRRTRTVLPASYGGAVNVGQQQQDRIAGGRQQPGYGAVNVGQQQDRAAGRQLPGYGVVNVGQQQDRMPGGRQLPGYGGAVNVWQQQDWMAGGRQLPNFGAPSAHSEQLRRDGARSSSFHQNSQSGQPQSSSRSHQNSQSSQQQSYTEQSSRSHQNWQSSQQQSYTAQSSRSHQNSQSSQQQSYTAQSSRSHQNSQSAQQQSSRSAPQPLSMGQQSSRPAARRS